MLCKITVIGNAGRDPEMRYTPNGTPLTSFSIAVNRRYTAGGERREETEWFDVTAFGRLGELVSQYVTKGRRVFVEGRFRSRSWEGQDGVTRHRNEITANEVVFLDRAGEAGGVGEARAEYGGAGGGVDADDLPF